LRLWVDTDVGTNPDDAIAIALACVHTNITLAGVSTVDDGDGRRAAVARAVLHSMGADSTIVHDQQLFKPDWISAANVDALLAIGPLTNVAPAVEAGVAPARVAVMGGALVPVTHRGARREVESNFGADPDAAARVLAHSAVLLVPLDVTASVCLDDVRRAQLASRHASLRDAFAGWDNDVCLHDPLALLALADEPLFATEARRLSVDRTGRVQKTDQGPVHRVVVRVDRDAAISRMLELLDAVPH
jgi:purine nucleosidase